MRTQASCLQKSNTLPSKEKTPSVFTFPFHLCLPLYHTFITEAAALSSDFLEKGHSKEHRGIFRLILLQLYYCFLERKFPVTTPW